MTRVRKTQFWLDNQSAALTEYTSYINSAALERAVDILENVTLNANDVNRLPGIRSAQLPLNGFYDTTSLGIVPVLDNAQGTSVSKTFQYKVGSKYYYGECYLDGSKYDSDGKKLVPWSTTLMVDGAVNVTSVAQS